MHLMGLEFFALEVRLGEHKGCGEITPDKPAALVGKMQVVPRRNLELPRFISGHRTDLALAADGGLSRPHSDLRYRRHRESGWRLFAAARRWG
jgi:hypothetical protein